MIACWWAFGYARMHSKLFHFWIYSGIYYYALGETGYYSRNNLDWIYSESTEGIYSLGEIRPRTVHSFIRRFLSTRYKTRPPSFDVPKLDRYFPLPYFGAESEKMKREVISLLTKVYPFLNPRIVLRNPFSVSTFFKYKDRLPKCCQSSVVYEFSCASCGASYVGSTLRNLHSRIQQHLGKSVRTGKFLTNPDPSPIRDHSLSCDTPVRSDNFSILGKTSSPLDLRILESLHIFDRRPSLNNMSSSFALQTVR